MARPLRIDVEGGWYHVMARGIERRVIFETRRDHLHFLDLLPDMVERYGVEVHAYALMGNHYHLLLRTPAANASAAVQWLNVSYSAWFNRVRQRVGHVFQGRFGSVLIDGAGAWALAASVYIHLNPVRTKGQGLDKHSRQVEARGLRAADWEVVRGRLAKLRVYSWTSYRAYAGYEGFPEWLVSGELLKRAGGSVAYRRYVERHVTSGADPEEYADWRGRVALGSQSFLAGVKTLVGRVSKEQPDRVQVQRRVTIADIVAMVEQRRGEAWPAFSQRHGDWGRELVLYLARRRSGLTLREIGEALGIAEYKTVGKAVQRFEASLSGDATKRKWVKECQSQLSLVET